MEKGRVEYKWRIAAGWAYALGCAVGWGAFMMPGSIFLPEAGPVGSIIGIVLAAFFMVSIGNCTSYTARVNSVDMGVHVYIGKILGADHGYLSGWAILLTYLSILWSNSTAFILLIRYIGGNVLQFGFYYTIAGYDVYLGEILATILVILFFGFMATIGKKITHFLYPILALSQLGLLIILFACIFINGNHSTVLGFAGNEMSHPLEIFNILMLAPWMFVGFEAFMYMPKIAKRDYKSVNLIATLGIIAIAIAYILPMLIPVLALPKGVSTWQEYLRASSTADGLMELPVFYSIYSTLGRNGLKLLVVCVVCAMSTSILGMYKAASWLIVSLSKDNIVPKFLAKKNHAGEPYIAIWAVAFVSMFVPFLGRNTIGWIFDITTIAANIVYIYSMAASYKLSKTDKKRFYTIRIVSVIGMLVACSSFLFLLLPNHYAENSIASESYFILVIWCIIGMAYYWYLYRNDDKGVYGKSPTMWLVMSSLIPFSSIMWVCQRNIDRAQQLTGWQKEYFIENNGRDAYIQILLTVVVLVVLFSLFSILIEKQKELDKHKYEAEMKSKAKTEFLFNMSHDIRTPMNAILGFTDLALLNTDDKEKMDDYLGKIKSSGDHLLSLINDILEMSRIESGKLELVPGTVDLLQIFSNVDSITRGLAEAKNQTLIVDTSGVKNRYVYTDRLRLNQVLLNLVSNAIKYTDKGGQIEVTIKEKEATSNKASYTISVKDNGIGMTEEFAAKVFEAFEREDKVIAAGMQGTGLGMAITKRIIDLMDGDIKVDTRLGEGTNYIIEVNFDIASEEDIKAITAKSDISEADFAGKTVLLADDYEINREIATAILGLYHFNVEQAVDGKDALEKVIGHPSDYYDIVFLDIQMPNMTGYEVSKAIRKLSDRKKAMVPIIAMTANAFEEDVKNALAAGMDGHVAKPIDQEKLVAEIIKALGRTRG